MQRLISFLKVRLLEELPHHDIQKEGLSQKLVESLIEAENARNQQFMKEPPRICAVMIAFYPDSTGPFLPMMVRPDNIRAHPGQISFPGGKQEIEDQDLIATAIRETQEEIGVLVPRENILGELSPVYIPPSNSLVTPIVGFLAGKPSYVPDQAEVAEVLDVPLSDLQNPANRENKKVILSGGEWVHMPAFRSGKNLIWGATARMITELMKVLAEM